MELHGQQARGCITAAWHRRLSPRARELQAAHPFTTSRSIWRPALSTFAFPAWCVSSGCRKRCAGSPRRLW